MDHIQDFQKAQRERILGCYGNANDILKSDPGDEQSEDPIEKGGEGSKGGKVIGHTRSGKPIYDKHDHPAHAKFTHADHADAAAHHEREGRKAWDDSQEAEDAGKKGEADKHETKAKNHDEQHTHHQFAAQTDDQKKKRYEGVHGKGSYDKK